MKKFNLKEAQAGKPVCTRDGRKARIICWDCKEGPDYPIVVLVEHEDHEFMIYCTNEGRYDKACIMNGYDLMMVGEKKEGWINIYKGDSTYFGAIQSLKQRNRLFKREQRLKVISQLLK